MKPNLSRNRSLWLILGILFVASAGYTFVDWTLHRANLDGLWTSIARALVGAYLVLIWRSLKENRPLAWGLIWWGMIAGCVAYIFSGITYLISFELIWLKLWTVVVIAAPVALLAYYKIIPFYREKPSFIAESKAP